MKKKLKPENRDLSNELSSAGQASQQVMIPVAAEAFHRIRALAEVGEAVESGKLQTVPPGHIAVPAQLAQRLLGLLDKEITGPEQQGAKLDAMVAALRRRKELRVDGAGGLVDAPTQATSVQ